MIELLMPAGNLKKLKTAIHFGADAVYLGGKNFSLRAFADNFTFEEIEEGIKYAHSFGKKVYVTCNIFAKNSDLKEARDYFMFLEKVGADAVLISDIGLVTICKAVAPNLTIHLSTQANTTNAASVKFWKDFGVKRVVLARELTFDEINEIHKCVPDIELEAFVHGAMCMSFSGRCLLSSYFTGRSANRGACAQPCRWSYTIQNSEDDSLDPLNVEEDARGTYFMNSKDLNLLARIPELVDAGVVSLKVEGRMKSEFYVATVAHAYRQAIDEYIKTGQITNVDKFEQELENVAHRNYTNAYFNGDNLDTVEHTAGQIPEKYMFIALVKDYKDGRAIVEMRNRFYTGDVLTVLSPNDSAYKEFTMPDITLFKDGTETLLNDAKLVQAEYSFDCPYELEAGDLIIKEK